MCCGIQLYMLYVLWDIVTRVICIVGYSYTCSIYCRGYSYTCSMYWGDTVIHIVCIVGDTVIHVVCIVGIQLYMSYVLWGYSYTCSMYCGGYSYSCANKSMCITFGETKQSNSINMSMRQWYIGTTPLEEVNHVIYLGTKLCSYNSNMERTKDRCNKGYALLGSLTAIGFNRYGLNPLTSATIWHKLCLPSILFGCELWSSMSTIEYEILDKVQRKVAKHLQGLHKRTHNEVAIGLLGWHKMIFYINKAKLLFVRHLVMLDHDSIIKHIFLSKLYSCILGDPGHHGSITDAICSLINQYHLNDHLNTYLAGGRFPGKKEWNAIVSEQINDRSGHDWQNGLTNKGAYRYMAIQKRLQPNILYQIIKSNKSQRHYIMKLITMISIPHQCGVVICNLCTKPFTDYVEHIFSRCAGVINSRNDLWDDILNVFGVEISAQLFQKEDEEVIRIMLGKRWDRLSTKQNELFLSHVAQWIHNILNNNVIHEVYINTL